MDGLQTTILALATAVIALAAAVILWRELGNGAEGGFLTGWRNILGLTVTLGGLAVLLTWLWVA